MAAASSVQRGQVQEERSRVAGAQRRDQQITALGASGVDVTQGSAADFLAQSAGVSSLDAATIRNNAAMEAMGYRTKAQQFRSQADLTRSAGEDAARSSILGGIVGGAQIRAPLLRIDGQETPSFESAATAVPG